MPSSTRFDATERRSQARSSLPSPLRRMALALAICGALGSGCAAEEPEEKGTGGRATDDDDDDGAEKEKTETKKPDAGTKAPPAGDDDSKQPTDTTKEPVKEDDGVEKCAGIRQNTPAVKGGVDVIFLIDTSGSMLHAITQVATNMAAFVQNFDASSADTRVVAITENDPAAGSPLASDAERYLFIRSTVDSSRLFSVALSAFPSYKDFLRPNAVTMFVMITDDEDAISATAFKDQMEGLLGHPFTQHAIASPSEGGVPCTNELVKDICPILPGVPPIPAVCGASGIGKAYYDLADATEGEQLSICKGDWTEIFEKLKVAVIEAVPLPCDYPLTEASSNVFDSKKVNILYSAPEGDAEPYPKTTARDKCGDKVGWHYDDEANPTTINLCPAACEQVQNGGTIDIEFGCAPPVVF